MTNFLHDFPASFPSYMRGPYHDTLAGAVGLELDNRAEQCLQARLAAIPYAGGPNPQRIGAARLSDGRIIECPPAVLPVHAEQRGVVLYATEPTLSQRIRVAQSWQIAAMDGTHWGEIYNVRPYFVEAAAYPTIAMVFQDNAPTPGAMWYQVDPSGARSLRYTTPSNFSYDAFPQYNRRCWAFLDMTETGYTPPATWGSFAWGDGTLWGQGGANPFTAAAAADIVAMFLERMSAHTRLNGVALVWPGVGGAPFPTASGVPVQNAAGWWSLPNGAGTWGGLVLPAPDGRASRPPNFQWILDNPPIFV